MIEVLGQAPISSVTTAGRSEFMSIFRNRASNSFGEEPNRYPRPYTSTRGILIVFNGSWSRFSRFSGKYILMFLSALRRLSIT